MPDLGPSGDDLVRALLSLRTDDEMACFLRDLCTVAELRALSERWQAVQKLDDGLPYRTVADETGMSTATVTRVAHWLNHGEGGYRVALDRRDG